MRILQEKSQASCKSFNISSRTSWWVDYPYNLSIKLLNYVLLVHLEFYVDVKDNNKTTTPFWLFVFYCCLYDLLNNPFHNHFVECILRVMCVRSCYVYLYYYPPWISVHKNIDWFLNFSKSVCSWSFSSRIKIICLTSSFYCFWHPAT